MKKILLVLLLAFIVIQFFRPAKNISTAVAVNDIAAHHTIPDSVMSILKNSCYDCHSNYTRYPWYNRVQPVAWWLADHVDEGKRELNFSIFGTYNVGRQYRKLNEITEQVKENEMPLSSYTLIHTDAKLSEQQKNLLYSWVNNLRDSIKAAYPEDSLKRPARPQPAK